MKKNFSLVIAMITIAFSSQAQNTWTQKADFGGVGRSGAAGFSIGNKGYVGTGDGYYNDFWEYDPVADSWTQKANFGGVGRGSAVGFSVNNKGYIGLGSDASWSFVKDFWEYDAIANTWTQKANFGGVARQNPVAFSIGNKGYVGIGYDGSYYKDFWEYDPAADTWTQKADFGGTARDGAVGFSIGSKGYIGTGRGPYTVWQKDFWEYDPLTDTWIQKADFGGTARQHAKGFSIGNKGYIGTGQIDFDGHCKNDFWEYDPNTDAWTQKANFGGTKRNAAVGISIGSKGYIGTGLFYDGNNNYYNDFWEYTPDICNGLTVYADADSDSYGDAANSFFTADCIVPSGYVLDSTDCDDANSSAHPKQPEITGDGIDNNCNGIVDENNALKFDGVDDYVNISNEANFDFSGAFTVELWIKVASFTKGWQAIITKGDNSWRLHRYVATNFIGFSTSGLSNVDMSGVTNVNDNSWHHVAAIYDVSNKYIYVDGNLDASIAVTGAIPNSTYSVAIGENLQHPARQFHGNIDEVRIWNIARTQSEIQSDMLGTTCGDQNGLIAYYTFNQGIASGNNSNETSLYDLTPNHNNGTLNNFSLTGSTSNWVEGIPGPVDCSCSLPTATITPLSNLDICETGFVKLKASSGNGYIYQWNRNQQDIPGATNQTFKAKKEGNYRVRIKTGAEAQCHSVSKPVMVYSSCKLSDQTELTSSLNVFPNPTSGSFTIDLNLSDEETSQAQVQLVNLLGQIVYDKTASIVNGALEQEINLSNQIAEGMYFAKVIVNDQIYTSQINYQK